MKVFDYITYNEEDILFNLRLNVLDKYIDKFIVTESLYTHSGKEKKLNFNLNKFSKFKNKIIYHIIEKEPENILKINQNDSPIEKSNKQRHNSLKRIEQSYDEAIHCLHDLSPEDVFILSDSDEIPNLKNINFDDKKVDYFIFKQKMFYYKFNLYYDLIPWFGSKACKFKKLTKPSFIRYLKPKKYPWYRFDSFFSPIKQNKIKIIHDGGWHFSNLKTPEQIYFKLYNFGHHNETEENKVTLDSIKRMIKEEKIYYDHLGDKKKSRIKTEGYKLKKINNSELPDYLINTIDQNKQWFS
jgi:beta-1,4-mannosyl-glycoprotein beta-1,4-N-acetylglucosaminyltransferase